jgi:hypothetical protein
LPWEIISEKTALNPWTPYAAGIPAIMLIKANLIRRPDMGSKGRKNEKKPKKQVETKSAAKTPAKAEPKKR